LAFFYRDGDKYYDYLTFLLDGPESKTLATSVSPQELATATVKAVPMSTTFDELNPRTAPDRKWSSPRYQAHVLTVFLAEKKDRGVGGNTPAIGGPQLLPPLTFLFQYIVLRLLTP
jgi:hypothetical protein